MPGRKALSVFVPSGSGIPLIDNTRRFARIRYRWKSYSKIVMKAIAHVPMHSLARSHFPFWLPDARVPPFLTVELTNACNVACTYCTSSLALRPRGIMKEATFARLLDQIRRYRIKRVRLVGNGEPTLHPNFSAFAMKLGQATPFLSIVTNGQRLREESLNALLAAPFRLIEISVDGGDKESYERSRVGGSFEALLENLKRLKRARDARNAPALLNLRLMLRPSQADFEDQLESFWAGYGDTVMRQYVIKRKELDGDVDVYHSVQRDADAYPRCALPFKSMDITWNGAVPLCHYSAAQLGEPGLIVGDINRDSIYEIWNNPIMKQYRHGHRKQIHSMTPICKGCSAV